MRYLISFLVLFVANSAALYVLQMWNVVQIQEGFTYLLLFTIVLALLHTFLKPIMKLLTFPFIILTFGLFSLVINGFLLWLTDYILGGFQIMGGLELAYATVLFTVLHSFVHNVMSSK